MMSAEVAVDAPPGLQHMGCGFGGPPLSPYQASSPPSSPGDMKDELIREVTDAVREHIELKTSSAVEVLWGRGQKALQQMQQNQLNQTAAMRAQLEAHAETQKKLEHDNAMLRQALEALVIRLSGVLSQPHAARAPPQVPSPQQPQNPTITPPHLESADQSQASAFAAAAALAVNKASNQVAGSEGATLASTSSGSNRVALTKTTEVKRVSFDCKPDNIEPETDSFHTPAGSPQRTTPPPEGVSISATSTTSQLPSVPSMPGFPSPVSSLSAAQNQGQTSVPTFSLILRRADNVPLGLDVRGEDNETCLLVESVRAGGAVEAWNKQCPDNARTIKAGDRIIKINDAEDSDSMRDQCINKYLLRLTVVRGQTASQHIGSLRAEADEFVPRVDPASSC